ncbi:MAG: endolytic transglycosylase MltG [Clostridia bacterium]|nr:endolytic transglycosylase MltG [Clostridia bacterium]
MNKKIIKRISKLIAAASAAAILLSLAGCSIGGNTNKEKTAATQAATVRVMFPEGSTVCQIAELLEKNGVCSAADFMALSNDAALASEYGIVIENPQNRAFLLEGYLYPDTYDFYVGESAEKAIRRFLKNAQSKFDDEFRAECEKAGMTVDEVITLASIIQEEAGDPAEMSKVSSVLHNRLNSKKFKSLQCDVTIFYLEGSVRPNVSEEKFDELRELYNTYKCKGLPEGPITNVGSEALNAALNPVESDWYYFVTDDAGEYHYAETWEEHQENCENAGL